MDEPPADRLHRGGVDASLPPRPEAPRRCTERRGDRARRHRLRPPGCLRLRHRDPAHGHACRGGRALQPVPCHVAVLADPGLVLHGPEPPRGRDGVPGRHPPGLPRLPRPPAEDGRRASPPAARRRVLDARRRQVAPHPALAALCRRAVRQLAARSRVRALLRVPPGRHQPLGAEPGVRQPLHRRPPAAPRRATTSARTWPTRPSAWSRTSSRARPGNRSSCTSHSGAMHAPHHVAPEWVDPYRGVFDRGWDAWRDELLRPPGRRRASCRRARCSRHDPEWVRAWSDLSPDERRMHSRQQEVFAGFLTHTDAQIGRVLSLAREPRRHGQHARHGLLRQRRQRGGGPAGQLQRAPLHGARARVGGREPRPLRRLGRLQHVQPLLVGVGVGRQHPAQALEALHVAGRDAHAADRALGPGTSTGRARYGHSSRTPST